MTQRSYKPKLLRRARRIVVKVGSSVLSSADGIRRESVVRLARALTRLHAEGKEVVLVTSGAVASGLSGLGLKERPKTIPGKQAAAAVGQIALMALYERAFSAGDVRVAQILLTHDDLANRRRYLNAKHTMLTLLDARVIPIVNENDTVAVEEIQFGDNDHLSSLVAVLVEADLLVILSDIEGLYDKDPRGHADARLIGVVEQLTEALFANAGGAGTLGRGGMVSKLQAAQKAGLSGIPTIIADGRHDETLEAVFDPTREVGTLFLPVADRLTSRKHWIAYTLKPAGELVVDAGALSAIRDRGRSLLPPGVRAVRGTFSEGECVTCVDETGQPFARGLVSYSSDALERIKGVRTAQVERILGYKISDEVIHRDDLALLINFDDQSRS
ncbi:MAG: glutamate 5-kinase [Deltaproteobacteria bacterium]|nr:glutamate 5-kinase [Deltaproteobacteria bacterium]